MGRGTLSWPLTPAIIHEGQLTLAKAYVSVVSQSFPYPPTSAFAPSLPAPARPLLRLIFVGTGDEFPGKSLEKERWVAGFMFS